MRGASAFDEAAFLGLARRSKRDPYRLALLAEHLEPEETPLALLAVHGGTLVLTDRRLLEFRAQLDHTLVRDVEHRVDPAPGSGREIEDALVLVLPGTSEKVEVSRGPAPTLSEEDFELLRSSILAQAK